MWCPQNSRPRQIGNGTYPYTYDPMNRLVAVRDKSTNTLMAQYFYDSAGERAAAITYNASGTATEYTQYLRSGASVIDEKTWALPGYTVTEERTYITVGGAMAVTRQTGGGTTTYSYYATDHLGTIRCTLTTNASGTEQSRSFHDFEPFGLEIPVKDTTSTNTHRFTGQERDPATGNDYMHFRFYGSVMGRFYKPDNVVSSAKNPQDWNLYIYVHGRPMNSNDPTGHWYRRAPDPGRDFTRFWNTVFDAWRPIIVPWTISPQPQLAELDTMVEASSLRGGVYGDYSLPADPLHKMLRQMQVTNQREVNYAIAKISDDLTLVVYELGHAINSTGSIEEFSRFLRAAVNHPASSSNESSLFHYVKMHLVQGKIEAGHTHPRSTEYGVFPMWISGLGIVNVTGPKRFVQTFSPNEYPYFKSLSRSPNLNISLTPGDQGKYVIYIH